MIYLLHNYHYLYFTHLGLMAEDIKGQPLSRLLHLADHLRIRETLHI